MMPGSRPDLALAAKRLTRALEQETALARAGALPQLIDAGRTKRAAFADFDRACAALDPATPATAGERCALRALTAAADESALVLEAVKCTLEGFAKNLRETARSMADCGAYQRVGRVTRHVLSVQLDAAV